MKSECLIRNFENNIFKVINYSNRVQNKWEGEEGKRSIKNQRLPRPKIKAYNRVGKKYFQKQISGEGGR